MHGRHHPGALRERDVAATPQAKRQRKQERALDGPKEEADTAETNESVAAHKEPEEPTELRMTLSWMVLQEWKRRGLQLLNGQVTAMSSHGNEVIEAMRQIDEFRYGWGGFCQLCW